LQNFRASGRIRAVPGEVDLGFRAAHTRPLFLEGRKIAAGKRVT
jgi:hypothetical protein